jgi:hypothetical protein
MSMNFVEWSVVSKVIPLRGELEKHTVAVVVKDDQKGFAVLFNPPSTHALLITPTFEKAGEHVGIGLGDTGTKEVYADVVRPLSHQWTTDVGLSHRRYLSHIGSRDISAPVWNNASRVEVMYVFCSIHDPVMIRGEESS